MKISEWNILALNFVLEIHLPIFFGIIDFCFKCQFFKTKHLIKQYLPNLLIVAFMEEVKLVVLEGKYLECRE